MHLSFSDKSYRKRSRKRRTSSTSDFRDSDIQKQEQKQQKQDQKQDQQKQQRPQVLGLRKCGVDLSEFLGDNDLIGNDNRFLGDNAVLIRGDNAGLIRNNAELINNALIGNAARVVGENAELIRNDARFTRDNSDRHSIGLMGNNTLEFIARNLGVPLVGQNVSLAGNSVGNNVGPVRNGGGNERRARNVGNNVDLRNIDGSYQSLARYYCENEHNLSRNMRNCDGNDMDLRNNVGNDQSLARNYEIDHSLARNYGNDDSLARNYGNDQSLARNDHIMRNCDGDDVDLRNSVGNDQSLARNYVNDQSLARNYVNDQSLVRNDPMMRNFVGDDQSLAINYGRNDQSLARNDHMMRNCAGDDHSLARNIGNDHMMRNCVGDDHNLVPNTGNNEGRRNNTQTSALPPPPPPSSSTPTGTPSTGATFGATNYSDEELTESESSSHPLLCLFQSFRLNQEHRPVKIVRASYQYLYDNTNSEYLDCVNSLSHVGHCHPLVVRALSASMDKQVSTHGWEIDYGELNYPSRLRNTLPEYLDTFLFCNSGSEAVDLSLQLSQLYTRGTDVVIIDNAFHGSIDSVHHLSPKVFKANNISKADWVHILSMPDLYRNPDPDAIEKYINDARQVIQNVKLSGKKISCFIAEPMLTVAGIIVPPPTWLQEIYKMVHEAGGLCIADEVQAGLGRIGSHFWSFQAHDISPDILIIGKTLGNGYPMASVVTSREIASVLGDRINEYKCDPVMDAVGCAVLDVVEKDNLMACSADVGTFLQHQLRTLQDKHEYIGHVRGMGLMVAVEIVWNKEDKRPAQEVADQIVHKMKDEYVIIANEGCNRNVLMMLPPMCFTKENAICLVQRLDKVLSELPKHNTHEDTPYLSSLSQASTSAVCEGRLGVFQPQEDEDSDNSTSNKDMDAEYSYQDLD